MQWCEGLADTVAAGGTVAAGIETIGAALSWRVAMVLPGVMGICYGALLIGAIDDAPAPDDATTAAAAKKKKDDDAGSGSPPAKKAGFGVYVEVLKNSSMWGLFFSYFCIAVIRGFISDWIPTFVDDK